MSQGPIDLLVIGSGPAGQRGAIQAAKLGKRVVLVEKRSTVGGVSLHTGTIPSKTLRETVLYLSGIRQRGFYGRGHRERKELSVDDLSVRLRTTIDREVDVVNDQLSRNKVEVVHGDATFLSPHRVQVIPPGGGTPLELTADKILLAPGTMPHKPAHIPFDGERVVDSDDILKLKQLPRSMVVVGSGVIGLEYASIFQALDVRVTLVDERETLLDFMDREIIAELTHLLRDRNMALRLGEKLASVKHDGNRVVTSFASGRSVNSDVVLFAAGRVGATASLNLSAAGLSADSRGRLTVDLSFRTSQPHIYAAGDVIGFPSLASTSMEQGRQAACHAFDQQMDRPSQLFPFGIYAVPEMSMVGATEEQLKARGVAYEVGISRFRELARGQILGMDSGMLKILVGLDDHKLLGVHILGEGATELIHVGLMVIGLGGTLEHLVESVFNYPTLAEAYKVAALDAWNRIPRRARVETQAEMPKLQVV